jgi:hypothetical protein
MPKDIVQQITTQLSLKEKATEIEALLARLHDIEPQDMAKALFTLEFHKELGTVLAKNSGTQPDQSELFFSRSLKDEIQSIYLELARHLKEQTYGSSQLMNAVFDFFTHTMKSLVKVSHFVSSN